LRESIQTSKGWDLVLLLLFNTFS